MKKTIIFIVFAAFMVLLPLGSVRAAEKIAHPFEDSVLLMISSQMRLTGEVESANAGNGHLASVSYKQLALQDQNELDILIQLYVDQINQLRQGGNHSPELEDKLVNELEDKVYELKEQAPGLVEVRRSGRRGGFLGAIGRITKAVGRGTGWLMGRVMEGSGKVVKFAIVEVAPRVLEKVVLGDPLTGTLWRGVAKDLLIKRVERVIIRQVEKRAERGPELDPVAQATEDAKYQDLDDELDLEEDESTPAPQGVLVYEFTQEDAVDTYILELPYARWKMGERISGYGLGCNGYGLITDSSTVHLEFNLDTMTVSGWMMGEGEELEWPPAAEYATFQIIFSDIPLVPGDGSMTAWTFAGEGLSSGSYWGTAQCFTGEDDDEGVPETVLINDKISVDHQVTQITGVVYMPLSSETDGITLRVETSIVPVDTFYYGIKLTVGETIDFPAP